MIMETTYNITNIAENSLMVKVVGRLDTYSSPKLDEMLSEVLSDKKIAELHFEFSGLEYISSSGLRVLLAALKKINKPNGTAFIENANDTVKSVLEMTGFNTLFEIVSTQGDIKEDGV